MNPKLTKLIPAIVSAVRERQSYVTKTKLLKLLYLFDLAWYRKHRETYTGFNWIFYLLGPWTDEYDPVLDVMYSNEYLRKRTGSDNFDTNFIDTDEQIFTNQLFDTRDDERIFEDVLRTWGDKTTPEILDYIYFRTEPMADAERGKPINFATASQADPPKYVPVSSGKSKQEIEAFRERISKRLSEIQREPKKARPFRPPHYDKEFFDAMDKLESMK